MATPRPCARVRRDARTQERLSMTTDSLAHLSAADIVRLLELSPHPEGGFYRETFRDARRIEGGRAASTAIYFLLPARPSLGVAPRRRRRDLALSTPARRWPSPSPRAARPRRAICSARTSRTGNDRRSWSRPTPGRARASLGAWTLVGCTVAPGFEFSAFSLADPGFPIRQSRKSEPEPRSAQPRVYFRAPWWPVRWYSVCVGPDDAVATPRRQGGFRRDGGTSVLPAPGGRRPAIRPATRFPDRSRLDRRRPL